MRNASRPWYGPDWRKLRREVFADPDVYCAECGTTEDLTLDHVEPRSLLAGVNVLCRSCNSKKGGL